MYEFSSRVRYSEIGPSRTMTPTSLVTRMQDCCVFQYESLDRGPDVWEKEQQGWMIISWQVIFLRFPVFGEVITTRTIPYRFHTFEGDRNFEIYAAPGKETKNRNLSDAENGTNRDTPVLCAIANSRWVYYDMKRQRPIRVPEVELEKVKLDPQLEMDYAPRRIKLPDTEPEQMKKIEITEISIDTNKHVNNLQYIDMARAYLPPDFEIGEMRVEYIRQCRLGDKLYPKVWREENSQYISLDTEEGLPCAIIVFIRKADM